MTRWQQRVCATLIGALVVLAGGCAPDEEKNEAESLWHRTFLLKSSEGFQPAPGTTVGLSFSETRVGFNAGCNALGGYYKLSDGVLSVSEIGGTIIGCDAPRAQQEEWVADFLASGPLLTLVGYDLTLRSPTATLVFLDRVVADPDRPLVGTPWAIVTQMIGGTSPTLAFGADGRVDVDTTCNTGVGSFVRDGANLTLTNMTYTANTCGTLDKYLQSGLSDGTFTVKIVAAQLTLKRGEFILVAYGP